MMTYVYSLVCTAAVLVLSSQKSGATITGWSYPQITGKDGNGTVTVNENTGTDVVIATIVATSSDGSSILYGSSQPMQSGDTVTFAVNSANGQLTLSSGLLDYESRQTYLIQITATDASAVPGTATVTVSVADLNDVYPVFDQTTVTFDLEENSPGGTPLTTVVATDGDGTSPNNEVKEYKIASGNTKNAFSVNGSTGAIVVAVGTTLSKSPPKYTLTVNAVDGGTPAMTGATTLTVNVIETTKLAWTNPPIGAADGSGNATGTIPENTSPGTETAIKLKATLATTYTITEQPVGDMFSIDNDGTITFASGELDYETTSAYAIVVVATDGGSRSGTATVGLKVGDVNDNAPELSAPTIGVHIPEGAGEGTLLTTLSATDIDGKAENNQISAFDIIGGNTEDDFIVLGTGEIKVAAGKMMSSERTAGYALVVTAEDSGTPTLTATATVFVLVLNTDVIVSWNNPDITGVDGSGEASGSIPEDLPTGSLTPIKVSAATATFYSIISQPVAGMFTIDNSGRVTLANGVLDYEKQSSYVVVVEAKTCIDNSGTATVTINIGDVNDVAPTFARNPYGAVVADKAGAGATVTTIKAVDSDGTSINNQIQSYKIKAGDVDDDFDIDSTGVITVSEGVTLECDRTCGYALVVEAEDNGVPKLNGTTTVYVVVTTESINVTGGGIMPTISIMLMILSGSVWVL